VLLRRSPAASRSWNSVSVAVLGVVKELTEIVARAAGDSALAQRTWVLLTESPEGGWGIAGHANAQADIAAAARAALSAGD
jgi:phenylpyruvate tautomerase PptA (4-oxalocrotonate tautomerase family)